MASPSRFNKIGVLGRTGTTANETDAYLDAVEFDVNAIASAAEQDTGIAAPTGTIQVISAYLIVETAEATAVTKTLTVGTTAGGGADALAATSVAATGPVGTPVQAAFVGGGNWSFTLAGADFANLASRCVVHFIATDA